MTRKTMVGAVLPLLGAVAATAYASSAHAAPSALVLVLMDRSGSMVDNGQCVRSGTGATFVDRKWVCGINDARDFIANNDTGTTPTRQYYFWQFQTMGGATTTKNGPFDKPGMISELNSFEPGGPIVDDAATPLASAFCEAVDYLMAQRAALALPTLPLYLKLESDGLENSTPLGDQCHGVDSGAGNAFIPGAITPLPVGGPYTSVNNLIVPSWQSNLLDKAITGVAHNPSVPPAFATGFGGTTVIAEITFLEAFIQPALMMRSLAALPTGPDSVVASTPQALVLGPVGLAAVPTGPSSTEDFVSYLSGLATATGGRFIRVGSGVPPSPGDITRPPLQPGDADGSGCVDQADAAIVERWLGQPVTPANPESYSADLNFDGVVNASDYQELKLDYGQGCATPPAPLPPSTNLLFGFEDASLWSSAQAALSLTESPKTQGLFALNVGGTGWRELSSIPVNSTSLPAVTSKVAFDIFIPTPPNRFWLGDTMMFVSIPSAGIFNAFMGNSLLMGKPINQFSTVKFSVPWFVRLALAGKHSDVTFKIIINGNGGYTFDNLRFVP